MVLLNQIDEIYGKFGRKFYQLIFDRALKNSDQDEIGALKNKKVNISTKKSNSADWRPVCKDLDSEIKLRHYSHKTLEAYRGWVRQLQGFARSKDPQLLSSTDVKDFLTYLVLDDMWLMYKIKVWGTVFNNVRINDYETI